MQKKFLLNLILVLFLNLLVKPFYILGIEDHFQDVIDEKNPGEFGMYFSILSLVVMFNILLDFGITNYNTRQVARNPETVRSQFSKLFGLRLSFSLIYFSVIFLGGILLGFSSRQFEILGYLGINQVLIAILLFFRSNISGLLMLTADGIIGVMDRLLLLFIGSIIIWTNWFPFEISVNLLIFMQMSAYVFSVLVAIVVLFSKEKKLFPKFNWTFSIATLKRSLPYALLILLMSVYYRVDGVMISKLLPNGFKEADLYAQGFRLFEALTMIGYLFAGLLLPIFSNMLARKENPSELVNTSFKLIQAVAIGLAAFLFVNAVEIIDLRMTNTPGELYTSSTSFSILMLCFIGMCCTYIYGTLLTANGSLKHLNYMALGGMLLNIILNLFFIPQWGAIGAAIASAVTQVLTALAQMILAHRLLNLRGTLNSTIRIILFALITLGVLSAFKWDSILANLIWSGSVTLIFALLFGLIDLKDIRTVIAKKQNG